MHSTVKTFLTILASVILSAAVTLLIQRQRDKAGLAGTVVANRNFVKCGLDANEHIVPDGKGSCIPPPPEGYIIDVPIPEGAVVDKYPVRRSVSADEMERTCPWSSPVSRACEDLYVMPKGISCIGKPFNTCIGGKKP